MTVASDWDGTLVDSKTQDWLPGALEALKRLLRDGHRVIIHTCRANWPEGLASIEAKLALAGVRGAHVWTGAGKPHAHIYVDNQAVTFEGDWAPILTHISSSTPLKTVVPARYRRGTGATTVRTRAFPKPPTFPKLA